MHAGSTVLATNCRAVNQGREPRHLHQFIKSRLVLEGQRLVRHTLLPLRLAFGALGALERRLAHIFGIHITSSGGGTVGGGGGDGCVVQRTEPPAGLPVWQPLGWRAVIVFRLGDEVVAIHIVVCGALRVLA